MITKFIMWSRASANKRQDNQQLVNVSVPTSRYVLINFRLFRSHVYLINLYCDIDTNSFCLTKINDHLKQAEPKRHCAAQFKQLPSTYIIQRNDRNKPFQSCLWLWIWWSWNHSLLSSKWIVGFISHIVCLTLLSCGSVCSLLAEFLFFRLCETY